MIWGIIKGIAVGSIVIGVDGIGDDNEITGSGIDGVDGGVNNDGIGIKDTLIEGIGALELGDGLGLGTGGGGL